MNKIIYKINALIASHSAWKMQVRYVIEGQLEEMELSCITSWRKCEFGKWLTDQKLNLGNQPEYKEVYQLHLELHVEAARAVSLALNGQQEEALKAIALGSRFATLSNKLVKAMMDWKQSLTRSAEAQPVLQWIG